MKLEHGANVLNFEKKFLEMVFLFLEEVIIYQQNQIVQFSKNYG